MAASCYLLVLLQLLSTMNYGLTATGGGTPRNGVDPGWQTIVSTHLCPLVACEKWCACSEIQSGFTWGDSTVTVSPECRNTSYSMDGKLKSYTDCDLRNDTVYFRWWPTSQGALDEGKACRPFDMAGALLERVRSSDGNGLYWKVCLTEDQCLNVTELCTSVPLIDICSIYNRDTDSITTVPTPRQPGQGIRTTPFPDPPPFSGVTTPKSGNAGNKSQNTDNGLIPDELRTAFIVGVGVGLGGAVCIILVCCLVIYIRRKMNRNRQQDQQTNRSSYPGVDSNHYSTIERPIRNGSTRPFFTISPQTSVESGSPQTKKKMKKKNKKSNDIKLEPVTTGPYTEYYADRTMSSYAGLQHVQSDSALSSKEMRNSVSAPYNIFAEYQEPDLVMPKPFNMCMFDDKRMSTSSSFNSCKLQGVYMDPEDINRPHGPKKPTVVDKEKEPAINSDNRGMSPEHVTSKHFKQKSDESTTSSSMWHGKLKGKHKKIDTSASCKEVSSSSRQCPNSPDIDIVKDGTLFQELKATLNKKKKPVSKSESTPLEIEAENPYAEVGEVFFADEPQRVSRQRSHSQPMVSTLSGYRTYEEIKLTGYHAENSQDQSTDLSAFPDANPYFELEDPNASRRHYFELENLNEETCNQQYFVLEKPSSLPLDANKKKKQTTYCDQHEKTPTLYRNDTCVNSGSGFKHNHFDLCVDNDSNKSHLNCVGAKAPTYFQLETPRERSSLGSMAQEYMSSSENEFGNDRNSRAEGTLTFYPGGRKRSSTYSLEEQAYDRLNRSARSSRASNRRSMINIGTPTAPDGPYACISSPSEECNPLTKTSGSKNKAIKKK